MRKLIEHSLIAMLLVFLVFSCDDPRDEENEDDPRDTVRTEDQKIRDSLGLSKSETIMINNWINENLNLYYYWYQHIDVDVSPAEEPDPSRYFQYFLYEPDRWSYISSDYESVFSELQGTPKSHGYDPSFYLKEKNSNEILMFINFVYPGSPAERAGLKRGDLVLTINGEQLTTNNYINLYNQESQQLGLAEVVKEDPGGDQPVNVTIQPGNEVISSTKEVIITDPILADTILHIDGKKIGYLAYVKFLTGENDQFLDSLDLVFKKFNEENITELILDLRYNPGGSISSASYLASSIVPSQHANKDEKLIKVEYNKPYEDYILNEEDLGEEYLYYFFRSVNENADIDKLYCLTTRNTASASELIIVGLKPYMEMVTIGEETTGKFYGSSAFYDINEPREHDYVMFPIIFKYENVEGFPAHFGGLTPDHQVKDIQIDARPFGDTADPMISKALSLSGLKRYKAATRPLTFRELEMLEKPAAPLDNLIIEEIPGINE